MPALRMFQAFRATQFRLIFAGQLVSGLGDWLDYVAILILVAYTWHYGPGGLAVVAICAAVPWIVVSPFAGVWADRLPRRTVMVGCDLARAGLVLCYLLAHSLPVLMALLMVKVSFSALFSPAERGAVRQTVSDDDLLSANTLTTLVSQSTKILGPALGGLLVATAGVRGAFIGDSVSFVLSAAFLSRLSLARPAAAGQAEDAGAKPGFLAELSAGFRFIVSTRVLLAAVLSMAMTVFLVFAFDTLTPLAVADLGLAHQLLGFAIGAVGLGSAVGAVAVSQWGNAVAPLRLMCLAQIGTGTLVSIIGFLILGQARGAAAAAALVIVMVGIGFAASGLFIGYPYIMQSETPQQMMGRVAALSEVIPTALQLLAPVVGASLAVALGIGPVFAGAGVLLAVLGITIAALPVSRRRAAQEPQAAPEQPDLDLAVAASEADVLAHWEELDPGPDGSGAQPAWQVPAFGPVLTHGPLGSAARTQ